MTMAGVVDNEMLGIDGNLELDSGVFWNALLQDEPDAWLDVKGAFLNGEMVYQVKDPVKRAECLQRYGSA